MISITTQVAVRAQRARRAPPPAATAARCRSPSSPGARDIPVQFLEQLFATLRRAGVLRSQRGVKGGYSFARPAGRDHRARARRAARRAGRQRRRPACSPKRPRRARSVLAVDGRRRGRRGVARRRRGDVPHLTRISRDAVVGLARSMGRIPTNIAAHVGRTPMVELARMLPGPRRPAVREARGAQPRRERQGPDRRVDDRGRRAGRASSSRAGRRSSRRPAATPGSRWRSCARPRATSSC